MILRHRPLLAWPGKFTEPRRASPFRSTWSNTLDLLDRELHELRADPDTVVLQVAVDESQCRLDGQLRANVQPRHPGVILSFESRRHGPLSYPCDAFEGWYDRPGWRENVRAIALGLEALRKVDRYGIAATGQQYTGWKQLGSGIAMPATVETMTADEAARLIASHADLEPLGPDDVPWPTLILENEEAFRSAWRRAAARHHPDVGGDAETFRRLTLARNLLANL